MSIGGIRTFKIKGAIMANFSKKDVQEKISIPSNLTDAQKIELGERIIAEVRRRTKSGIDKNGNPFKGYSKSYKSSLDFKNSGKSSKVNISSSGDTLAELDVLQISSNTITIGYDVSDPQAGIAAGNVLGTYGNSNPVTSGRDFIGLEPKVVKRIIAEIKQDPDFQVESSVTSGFISNILGRFNGES